MKKILIGVDGSIDSLDAVRWLATFAPQLGAAVTAVTAYGMNAATPFVGMMPLPDGYFEDWRRDLTEHLDGEWTAPLVAAGVSLTTRVEEGDPATILLRLAHEVAVDLIVVGSRGRGSLRELVLGSVGHALILRAGCPVVIHPHLHHHHDDATLDGYHASATVPFTRLGASVDASGEHSSAAAALGTHGE